MDSLEVALNKMAIAMAKLVEDGTTALKVLDKALAPHRDEWSDVVEVIPRSGDDEDREMYDVCSYTKCEQATMHRHADQPAMMMPRSEPRRFPMNLSAPERRLGEPKSVSWSTAEKAYIGYVARYGDDQSLERLAERGGFGVAEMNEFVPDWRDDAANQ